jgi:hypothetical protein
MWDKVIYFLGYTNSKIKGGSSIYSAKYCYTGFPLPWMLRRENSFLRFDGWLYTTISWSIPTHSPTQFLISEIGHWPGGSVHTLSTEIIGIRGRVGHLDGTPDGGRPDGALPSVFNVHCIMFSWSLKQIRFRVLFSSQEERTEILLSISTLKQARKETGDKGVSVNLWWAQAANP